MNAWQQLAVAVALVFIIEGMIPFVAPARWRNMVRVLAELDDRTMRGMGLASIRERAEEMGGRASIRSAPGQGASVKVEVDLDRSVEL